MSTPIVSNLVVNQQSTFEIWLDIPSFEGLYQVSSVGRVKSLSKKTGKDYKQQKKETLLKPFLYRPNSYPHVSLCKEGKARHYPIHRLVALAFIPNPLSKPQVNHKDGNKQNNCVSNLEWVTAQENMNHAKNTGLFDLKGTKNHATHLTDGDVRTIFDRRFESARLLAKEYNVSRDAIQAIWQGKSWTHVTGAQPGNKDWLEASKERRSERNTGEKNNRATLTDQQVTQIRAIWKQLDPKLGTKRKVMKELAVQFNTSWINISRIVLNRMWKHLL